MPLLLTYLITFHISKIDKLFYIKQKSIEEEKIKIKQAMENRFIKEEKEIIKEEKEIIKDKEVIINKNEEIENKEKEKWNEEYEKILKKDSNILDGLSKFIYQCN
jgi:hypothetical protein